MSISPIVHNGETCILHMAIQSQKSPVSAGSPRLGVAFSGGATRGMAHIGVLKAFQDNGIQIDLLAGTSIGAMVAAFHAFGLSIETMRQQAVAMSWSKVSAFTISRSGLLSNRVIGEIVERYLGRVNIEDAPVPLAIIATDIANGEKVVLREGNLARAIMASTCVPGIFTPIEIGGRLLVDGFLVENVPISPLQSMDADLIAAVCLSTMKVYREPSGMMNILMNAFEIAIDSHTRRTIRGADVIVEPNLTHLTTTDPDQQGALFDEGYAAGLLAAPKIRQQLQQLQQPEMTAWQKLKHIFRPRGAAPSKSA